MADTRMWITPLSTSVSQAVSDNEVAEPTLINSEVFNVADISMPFVSLQIEAHTPVSVHKSRKEYPSHSRNPPDHYCPELQN